MTAPVNGRLWWGRSENVFWKCTSFLIVLLLMTVNEYSFYDASVLQCVLFVSL